MLATANLQDYSADLKDSSPSPNPYSRKIAMVCAMHGIPSGNLSNLATFMRALPEDKGLAMNFWSLMAKMHDLQQGSNQPLLEAIAEGVTGHSLAEIHAAGGEPQWRIKQMAAMLAGEDIDLSEAVRTPVTAVREDLRVAEAAHVLAPVLVLTAPAASEAAVPAKPKWQLVSVRLEQEERLRLALEPEKVASMPLAGQTALFGVDLTEEPVRANRVPLEGYGVRSSNGSGRMIAFAALLLVAAGGAAFFVRGDSAGMQRWVGPSVHARYDAAWHGVKGLGNRAGGTVFGR